jgi:chaperone modulatory protein CbpM
MSDTDESATRAVLVEEQLQFTLIELSQASHADIEQLIALVEEGVLTPSGEDPQRWRFAGAALPRARAALRLTRDLDLNPAGAALVLELLDQIDALRAKLRRYGLQS